MSFEPLYRLRVDDLDVQVYRTNDEMGQAAACKAAAILSEAIARQGEANAIFATGNSQLTFLQHLCELSEIDWKRVNIFHMDEYVGLSPAHPASFPNFLNRHLVSIVKPKNFFPVPATLADSQQACVEYETLLRKYPADLCALGIGENGHLAFNDPPFADFNDTRWVKVVKLDIISRQQQVGEGHFKNLDEVPTHAITLTIPALLAAKKVLAIVPEARKADAVYRSLKLEITDQCPGSILRKAAHAQLFLDLDSAAKILPR